MTTREIYFKNLIKADLPCGLIHYTFKDTDGVIQIGKALCVNFKTDEDTVIKSLNSMQKIEQIEGFMFWNSSVEGETFFKYNWPMISKHLSSIILNQR